MKFGQVTDEELLREAHAGSMGAFEEIVRRHQGRVRGFLANYLFDNPVVDDLAQEVFLAMFEKLQKGSVPQALSRWLVTVAKFKAIDFLRSKSKLNCQASDHLDQLLLESQEQRLDQSKERSLEESEALRLCMKQLSPEHRELVDAFYFENTTAESIARSSQRKPASIRMMLLRIRKALGKCIRKRTEASVIGELS